MPSDVVALCDVYSAGETPRQGVTGNLIVEEMKAMGHENVFFVKHIDNNTFSTTIMLNPEVFVLTMGAGDVQLCIAM